MVVVVVVQIVSDQRGCCFWMMILMILILIDRSTQTGRLMIERDHVAWTVRLIAPYYEIQVGVRIKYSGESDHIVHRSRGRLCIGRI